MVTPNEDIQEQEEIVEVIEEAPAVISSSKKSFEFAVEDTDRPGLTVYTVNTKPAEAEWQTLTILAPNYDSALELAGINKDNTVKISGVAFEG